MPAVIFSSPRAETRLQRATAWLLAGGVARETLVVGATALAARTLVRAATATCGASFGWRPVTLGSLALSLALPRLIDAGVAAAGAAIVEGLSVRALHELRAAQSLGRLGAIADRPGLARAVARTLLELRMAGIAAANLAPLAPELGRILGTFEAHLEAEQLADRATVLALAAEAAAARASGPALLVVDVPIANTREAELIARLAAHAPDTLITAATGDGRSAGLLLRHLPQAQHEADDGAGAGTLARLQRGLFAEDEAAPAAADDGVVFMSAPGESRECVEIARRILREAAAGVPFDRIAILLRAPTPYRPHLEEALRRARIPVHFARGAAQPDPTGRAFLALLTCLAEGLSARRFAEYLSLGEAPAVKVEPPPPAPEADRWVPPDDELSPAAFAEEEPAPPTEIEDLDVDAAVLAGTVRAPRRWEQILVDAAVIGGRERWARRLDGWRAELHLRLGALEADDPQRAVLARDIEQLAALRGFALPILDDLAALPAAAPWGTWLDQLAALATRTLRWPDRVLSVLAELRPMAPVGPVGLREVRLALGRKLHQLVLRPASENGGRVFVGPIASARGLCFDVVFVPGLAERVFPQRVGQDPLLRDDLRVRLGGDLPTIADQVEAERLALRLAVGSARQRVVLSYSRIDAEQARPRVPSFYGLEIMRAVEGRLPSFEALAQGAERGAAMRLGWPAPADPALAIDEAEHDLSVLEKLVHPAGAVTGAARYLITSNPHLARALRHRAMRFDPTRWSYADGLVRPDEPARAALATHALAERSFSPTALQSYAACPYRFVLHAIHKLEPREEPVAIEKIDPLQKGSLVHEILFDLHSWLRDTGLGAVTRENFAQVRAKLESCVAEVAARYHDTLAPAIERVWQDGIASIRADLLEALRRESERTPWTAWKLELAFGLKKEVRGRDPSSREEPVALDCGIKLRGSIDLVEAAADGTLRATDHKTGKKRQRPGSVVGGGESLQPVFYALALEKLFPERRIAGGRLSYGTSAGEFKEVLVPLDEHAREAAEHVARAVGDALTQGFLPAAPGKGACRYCDYRPVCGPWEEDRARKKKDQRALAALEALRRRP